MATTRQEQLRTGSDLDTEARATLADKLSATLADSFALYPVPRNLNYFWNFGVLAGLALVILPTFTNS